MFKPLDERVNLAIPRRFEAARIYIAACCAQWAPLVFMIYFVCSQRVDGAKTSRFKREHDLAAPALSLSTKLGFLSSS